MHNPYDYLIDGPSTDRLQIVRLQSQNIYLSHHLAGCALCSLVLVE